MASLRTGILLLIVSAALSPLSAQTLSDTLTPAQIALACATPSGPMPPARARILGAQDPLPHTLLAPHELLVVGSGTDAGVRLGQQFFIRHAPFLDVSGYGRPRGPMSAGAGRATASRPGAAGRPYASAAFSSTTAGWLRIVSVNQTTAIARVEYACDAIFQGDYLEPFGAPEVPAGTDRDDFTGEPDFTSPARVTAAPEGHLSAGPGEYVVVDHGRDQGIEPGTRLAIYRDLRIPSMPLTPLGEAVVMSAGTDTSLVRINRARDAVLTGDYLVPRR